MLVHFGRVAAHGDAAPPGTSIAQERPLLLVGYALLFLMLFIAGNKVFSTQYLLWLAPLAALLPLGQKGDGLFAAGFLLGYAASTVLFPYLFLSDLVDSTDSIIPQVIHPPTARVAALLVVRNLMFLGLTVALTVRLLRAAWAPAGGA